MFSDVRNRPDQSETNLAPTSENALVATGRYNLTDTWLGDDGGEGGGVNLLQYWQMLMKHRWTVLGILVGAVIIGVAASLLMTRIYQADVTLQIEREAAKIINVEGVQPSEREVAGDEFYQTQYGLLKSKALATDTVNSLGLANNDNFIKMMGGSVRTGPGHTRTAADRERQAVSIFQKNLTISPIRGSRLVKLSFASPDPQVAARVANATAENFIAANLNRKYESADYAREFLGKRLEEYKAKLEESERQLNAYATQEQIINVQQQSENAGAGQGSSNSLTVSSLVALNNALATARGERIKNEERWRRSQGAPGLGLAEVLQNPTIQELSQAQAKLKAEYQDKLRIYKPEFPEMKQLQARIDENDKQIQAEVNNVRNSLKTAYDISLSQERSFEQQVNSLKSSALNLGQRTIQYDILRREADTNRTLYEGLLQRYKEVGVAGGISTNNISIVDHAQVPTSPAKPKPFLNIGLAAMAGLSLGIIAAFLLELMDDSISVPEDIESKLGLPLLGSVPKLSAGVTARDALGDQRSAFSEAYYSIRTALQFSTTGGVPSSILVTSSRPAEGKSTTAMAIARNLARLGSKVLLVDGDLRNPSMHRNMGADNSRGFSNFLTGSARIAEVAQTTDIPGLHFVPCGPMPPNPAELLANDVMKSFLAECKASFDVVVIDGPPVLGLADAPLLASATVGTVFVIESRGTRRGLASTALRRLQLGHARLLGGVLTKFDVKKASYGYGAGYSYAYEYNYGMNPKLPNKS